MSEYQYYEFQAVDRPLTDAEMREVRRYSSRARITPTTFVNEYNWGDHDSGRPYARSPLVERRRFCAGWWKGVSIPAPGGDPPARTTGGIPQGPCSPWSAITPAVPGQ